MPTEDKKRAWVEEVEVGGSQLLEKIKDLVAEGNARRVIIKTKEGSELLQAPLTVGVVAGGLITLAAPLLAALGALAGLVTQVKLQIIREEPVEKGEERKPEEHLGS